MQNCRAAYCGKSKPPQPGFLGALFAGLLSHVEICQYHAIERASLIELPTSLTRPEPRGDARFVMGIDGGTTGTLAAVFDLQTRGLHMGHGGPSNEDAVGPTVAVQALLSAADEALERAGIDAAELGAAVLAVAGTDTGSVAEHVRDARTATWIVVNDVVGAWAAATEGKPGVAAISRTGSNVFGVGPKGRSWRAGGWGFMLGDEGSDFWLGEQSIRAALRDRDTTGPETTLSSAVPVFFGLPNVMKVADGVYAKRITRGEIAAFAVETGRLAEAGDAVAQELCARGAEGLGRQITTVIRRTDLEGEFPVGLVGSGFKVGQAYVESIARVVHELAPGARVETVEMAPVGGSLMLAARSCGWGDELLKMIASAVKD